MVLDREGRYVKANARLLELLGLDERTYVGAPATVFTHPEERDTAIQMFRRSRDTRAVSPFRMRLMTVDGEAIPVTWSAVILDDGTMVGSGVPLVEDDADRTAVLHGPNGLELSRKQRTASVDGHAVRFTAAEFNILEVLLKDRGVVVSAADLAREAFGYDEPGLNWNFLQAHMSRIRKKLRPYGADDVIEAVRGIGYVCR